MQLIALKLELVSSDEVRPAFGPVIQGIPNGAKVLMEILCAREQYARLFKELANSGTVKVQSVFFNTQSQVSLPGTEANAKLMDRRIVIVNDTTRKGVSSSKR
jgi:orotate phosphoribosyltransferase